MLISKKLSVILIIGTLFFCTMPFSVYADTETEPFLAPQLSVPIPGMEPFEDIQGVKGGETMTIPWLAQYIAAGYKYFVGVAVILAIVLMMIGGFQWMTSGGNAEGVSAGKKRITHAVTGLALALGSYVILFTINPDLIELKSLNLQSIPADPLADSQKASGEAATAQLQGEAKAIPQLVNGVYVGVPVPDASTCDYYKNKCKNDAKCFADAQKIRDFAVEAQNKTGYPAAVMLAQYALEGPTFGKKCNNKFVPSSKIDQIAKNAVGCNNPACSLGYTQECITEKRMETYYKPLQLRLYGNTNVPTTGVCKRKNKPDLTRTSGYACFFNPLPSNVNPFGALIDFYESHKCYPQMKEQYGGNPKAFALAVQSCGYATGTNYGDGLIGKMTVQCFIPK